MLLIIILLNLVATHAYTVEKNQKIIPKEVSIECDNQGYPTKSALKYLATALLLNQQDQDKISIKKIPGGLYSEKLYVLFIKKNGKKIPLFFFKISKKTDSTKNLIKIQEGPIGQKFKALSDTNKKSLTTSQENLPAIIWLENVFTYTNQDGAKKTIEVTPSAQGKLVQDILDCQDSDLIKQTAYALGKTLAAFHKLFMDYHDSQDPQSWRTVCHGDFSIRNTLFEPTTNKIYFIDNEGMNTGSISQDLTAILTSFVMLKYLKQNHLARWPLYIEYCLSFLKGYIQSYPIDQRASLALFIKHTLTASLNKSIHKGFIKNKPVAGKEFNVKEFQKPIYNYLHKFSSHTTN